MDFNTPVVFKNTYRAMACLLKPIDRVPSNIFGPIEVTQTGIEFSATFHCSALDPFNYDEDRRWMQASNALKPEVMLQISLWLTNQSIIPIFSLDSLLTDTSKTDWRQWCLARFSAWLDVYNDQVMSGKEDNELSVPHQFVKDMCVLSYCQYLAVKGEVVRPFDLAYLRCLSAAVHQKFGPGIEGERLSRFKLEIEERASAVTGLTAFDIPTSPFVLLNKSEQWSGSEIWQKLEDIGSELLEKVIAFFGRQKADEDAFYEKTNRLVLKDLYVEVKYHIDENPDFCDRAEIVLHKGYCPHAVFVNELEKLPVAVKTVNLKSRNMVGGAARTLLIQEAIKEANERRVRLRLHESFLDAIPRYKEKADENGFYNDENSDWS